jgi:hypothetical protein
MNQIILACEELRLIEEARGWIRLALEKTPEDRSLVEARNRLAGLQLNSMRNPMAWEALP